MIKRILALGGISMAVAFAQSAAPAAAPTIKNFVPVPSPNETMGGEKVDPNFKTPKTPWGDPDLQGIWPTNHLIAVGLQRSKANGNKLYLTDDELAKAQAALDARNKRFQGGPIPQADTSTKVMRQTSLIVSPADGQFPQLTEYGKKLQADMKSSYKPGQTVFDSIEDFSAWDRCITRGMPVSMEPRNYNNGYRIIQSPGYVTIIMEMAHEARVIPVNNMPELDPNIKEWLGEARGHWEGNTLVVESKNFNGLVGMTSAGAVGSPAPLQPETTNLRTIEHFTRVSPDEIDFQMTVDDPQVLTAPIVIAYPMFLDNKYEMFEYACHEGNTAVRNYIETSRYERTHPKK